VHAALEAVHPHNPYTATKRITATASELEGWRHRAQGFIPALEKVLDGLQGTQVVLCTLPGLYESNTPPSTRALEIGHMPPLTCDPTALAALVEGYNAQLRSLARRRNLGLIDLETWGHAALTPRDELFFDSLHLWENGQARIGRHMAQQLAGLPALRPPRRRP